MPKTATAIRLEQALRRAVGEHGAKPRNRFSPAELATFYGGPSAMVAGRCADTVRSLEVDGETYSVRYMGGAPSADLRARWFEVTLKNH